MADVVIRGMKMPETCGLCNLCLDDSRICNGYCMFFHRRVNMMERDKNCPLLPLPAGHGRLIDADALIKNHFSDEHRIALSYANKLWMRRIINGEPTIVPEEGGADNG